jgi:hypothetical protein
VRNVTLSASYLPDNELEGKGACESLVLCMEEMYGIVGSGSCIEKGKVIVVMMTMKLSFTETLRAFESIRAFLYAHDITKRDQANIVNVEMLVFSFKRKGATKQMRINDFFKKM